jgi:hypothetical protein
VGEEKIEKQESFDTELLLKKTTRAGLRSSKHKDEMRAISNASEQKCLEDTTQSCADEFVDTLATGYVQNNEVINKP